MPHICPGCGAAMDDSARFCPACGAKREDEAADVFVLKPGTARLAEDASPAAEDGPMRDMSVPVKRSRREKRIARKLRALEAEEAGAAAACAVVRGADTMRPPRANWRIRLVSLFVAVLLVAAVIGGLYLREKIAAQAFSPVEAAYSAFAADTPRDAASAYPEELYRAMDGLGYFGADGPWAVQYADWKRVYGAGFTAEPALKKMSLLRGEEKEACLQSLQTEYMVTARPLVALSLQYTVSVHSGTTDAAVRKTACVGYMGGKWYLLQAEF